MGRPSPDLKKRKNASIPFLEPLPNTSSRTRRMTEHQSANSPKNSICGIDDSMTSCITNPFQDTSSNESNSRPCTPNFSSVPEENESHLSSPRQTSAQSSLA